MANENGLSAFPCRAKAQQRVAANDERLVPRPAWQVASTPNLDRLVARWVSCEQAYPTCPVCVPARYGIMTGCEPGRTGWFGNWQGVPDARANCGPYLAETLRSLGYRTFGLGKFHTHPRREPLGFEVHEYSEEIWPDRQTFLRDDYVVWLRNKAPAFVHLEQVHGERTDMYYIPQTRPQRGGDQFH